MGKTKTFNLADLLSITVDTVPPDRVALVCGARRVTYPEFFERAQRIGAWLRSRGVGANDTVGIHAYTSIEFMEATFGAYLIKAVPVNVNYRYTVPECRYIYDNAELKALVYGAAVESCVAQARDAAPGLRALLRIGDGPSLVPDAVSYEAAVGETTGGTLDDVPRSDDDTVLLFTGGTTGAPKGVIWPHKALFFAAFLGGSTYNNSGPIERPEQLADRVRENFHARQLPGGPLMHGAGMWATTMGLLAGATVYLNELPDFRAEYMLDLMTREKISILNLVGDAMAIPLIDALAANPGRWDLSGVFVVSNGGAVLSEHNKKALKPYLAPAAVIVDALGSSETGSTGTGNGKAADGGFIRIPPNPAVAVVVDGNRFARPGETGVLGRMGHLPLGYYRDPEKTAATFVTIDGKRCALSGDIARLEEDGSISVFGRDSQCINTGGEKVYAEEVEEVLRSHASIADAVVIGVPDPRWGQKVVGVVSVRNGSTPDESSIREYCKTKLAGYKVPKHLVVVDEVPRSPMGKANYRWARETAEQALLG